MGSVVNYILRFRKNNGWLSERRSSKSKMQKQQRHRARQPHTPKIKRFSFCADVFSTENRWWRGRWRLWGIRHRSSLSLRNTRSFPTTIQTQNTNSSAVCTTSQCHLRSHIEIIKITSNDCFDKFEIVRRDCATQVIYLQLINHKPETFYLF